MASHRNKNKSYVYEEEIDSSVSKVGTKKTDKEIILKIENEEFPVDKDRIASILPFLHQSQDDKGIRKFSLPSWVEKTDLEIYLNNHSFLKKQQINDFDSCKKIISLCILFKNEGLMKSLINEFIIPNLDKKSCIRILTDYRKEISHDDFKPIFIDLFHNCTDVASKNIFFLINNHESDLSKVSEDILEIIFER